MDAVLAVIIARYVFIIFVLARASLDPILGLARVGDQGLSIGAALNAVIIGIGLVALAIRNRPSLRIPALIWLPYLTIAGCSLAYTPDLAEGGRLFLSTLTFPAMFISAFVLLRSDSDMIVFLRCIVYSSIVPVIYGIFQIASGATTAEFRVNSTFGHANIFAFYLVAVLVAILYHNIFASKATSIVWRTFSRAWIFVLLGLLVETQTRSAWIEVAFILLAYGISVNRKLLLGLPLVPLVLFVPQVADRLTDLDTGNRASFEQVQHGEVILNSYAWRKMLWDSALSDSANARITGKGLGAFHHNVPYFFPLTQSEGDAHSGYVQAIYEIGLVGLVAYSGLYLSLLFAVFRFRRTTGALANIILAFVIGNLIINYSDNLPYYLNYNWYAWAIFGADLSRRLRYPQVTLQRSLSSTTPSLSANAGRRLAFGPHRHFS